MEDAKVRSGPARGLTTLLQELAAASPGPEEAPPRLAPGERVDRYEVLREIGRGGFGVVYEALDVELGRKVALKMLRPSRNRRQLSEEWLRQEADACARLDHPGLVTLHDAGTSPAGPWLAMELLRGETLAERIARGPLPVADAMAIAIDVAEALGHAHACGVLHRDLKPGNVFISESGRVKLLDFGLAHVLGTRAAPSGGTPAYMAPEQALGSDVDARADIFAAGVILYEMLTGAAPFSVSRGRTTAVDAAAPPELPTTTPRAIRDVVSRSIARDRAARPANGAALAEQLRIAAATLAGGASGGRWSTRTIVAAVVAATCVAAVAVAISLRSHAAPTGLDRAAIAVADAVNETGDPELDGVSELLITALEPSARVQVLTRSRIADALRAGGRTELRRIDETLAIAVAKDVGMKALLVPSVRKLGDAYAVGLRAIDPFADAYLFAIKDEALDKRGVLAAIDRLAAHARRRLGESDDGQTTAAPRAETIANLAAYRHYFDALRYSDQGLLEEEQRELRKALELDPEFPLAHLRLAGSEYAYPPLSDEERVGHLRAAQRAAARLPEADRLFLEALLAVEDRQLDRATELLERAVRIRPEKRAYYRLAQLHGAHDLVAGRPWLRKALALDPAWIPAQNDLAISYCWNGEHAEAERLASEWAARWPSAVTFGILNGTRLWAGDFEGAMDAARKAQELGPGVISHVGRTLVARGEFAAAEAELRRLWDRGEKLLYDVNLADALRYRGKRREASAALGEMERSGEAGELLARPRRLQIAAANRDDRALSAVLPALRRDADAFSRAVAALVLVAADRRGDAEAVLGADVTSSIGGEATLVEAARAVLAAARAREERDIVKARRILEDARSRSPFAWQRTIDYFLGEVCYAANDDTCAVEALARVRATPWGVALGPERYLRASQLLAASFERMGRLDDARAVAEQLHATLAEGDEDVAAVASTRELCARLSCRTAGGVLRDAR